MPHQSNILLLQNKPTWNILCGKVCLIIFNSYSDATTKMQAAFCIELDEKELLSIYSTLAFQIKPNSTIPTNITSKII